MFAYHSRFLLVAFLSLAVVSGLAQRRGASLSNAQAKNKPTASQNSTDSVKEGSAWTLTFPLGDHVESKIDTLSYNFQRTSIPAMVTDAYASTGNLGAEGIDMIYFQRPERSSFFFRDALDAWLPSFNKQKFYNVYIPTTILSYGYAGNKQSHQDRLSATFAGNVNRRIGVGAMLDYLYSKGSYEAQAVKNFTWGFSGYYLGDRYEMQAFYYNYALVNKENGGITDDLYITDPGELQGGVDKIEPKSIPTRLSAAHNRTSGDQLFMTHAYKIGFWKTQQVNDTLSREIYVPMTRIIYSFDLRHNHHMFLNTNSSQAHDFWSNFYLNPDRTDDHTRLTQMTNSLGIELIEGFQKWAKFGLSAFASYQTQKFKQATALGYTEISDSQLEQLTPLPSGLSVAPTVTKSYLWVGGRLQKDKGSLLRYAANVRFGLVGDVAGDLELDGNISSRFKLFGDSVKIAAKASFTNKETPYLLRYYISNHFAWANDFGKVRNYKVEGELHFPWTRTTISAGVENVQNMVYFNSQSLPQQYGGNVQVLSARLDQQFKLGILHWDNTLYYQKSSNESILPLPQFTIYSNLYLKFIAFKVLKLQLGVDCDYYTSYYGLDYQPATMSFHVQGDDKVKVGNYPLINAYVTARLYRTRFYVLWSHVNQGMLSKNSFVLPHYPMNPRRLEIGLSIDFAN
ncbi:MAG: putative porin [Muribaculaceae bacterium]|nr:putative porin [Muribaculaceae bacterium]